MCVAVEAVYVENTDKTVVAVVAQISNSDLTTNEQYSRVVFVYMKRF